MRRSSGVKPTPLLVAAPSSDLSLPGPLHSSRRRLHEPSPTATPPPSHHDFDTLVTEVDTLSPHHSHESLPAHPLSANRLLRDATLEPEPEPPAASASPRRRSHRRRQEPRPRQRRTAGRERSGERPSDDNNSLDRRSAFSRDSASTRGRQPLPWVSAAPVSVPVAAEEESLPPYTAQPPPYSRWTDAPPSPALYVPPERGHSPYENWPMPVPQARPQQPQARTGAPGARYENAWSPVPPAARGPPSSASGRGGVIFFRSGGGGAEEEGGGHSFGGSVMV